MRDDAVLRRALPLGRGLGRQLLGPKYDSEMLQPASHKEWYPFTWLTDDFFCNKNTVCVSRCPVQSASVAYKLYDTSLYSMNSLGVRWRARTVVRVSDDILTTHYCHESMLMHIWLTVAKVPRRFELNFLTWVRPILRFIFWMRRWIMTLADGRLSNAWPCSTSRVVLYCPMSHPQWEQ